MECQDKYSISNISAFVHFKQNWFFQFSTKKSNSDMVPTNYTTQSYVSIVSTAGTGSLYMTAVNKHFHTKLVKIFMYIYM